jgi:hypothetical protein
MRNLLALLGATVVAFAILGYFLDWYNLRTITDGQGHRHQVIDVNPDKAVHDVKETKEVVNHLLEKKPGQSGQEPAPTPENSPAPSTPGAVVVRPTPDSAPTGDGVRLP